MKRRLLHSLIVSLLITLFSVTVFAQKPELVVQAGHSSRIVDIAISSDNKTLISGDEDGIIIFWDMKTLKQLRTIKAHSQLIDSLALSPDGKVLASAGGRPYVTIKLWDVNSGQLLHELDTYTSVLAFSPDGKILASGSTKSLITLWDVSSGKIISSIGEGKANSWTYPSAISFSPDGGTIAGGSYGRINIWDIRTGMEKASFEDSKDRVYSLAYNPANSVLASSAGNKVELWDTRTSVKVRELSGHKAEIKSIAFTSDGSLLASGSEDGEAIFWRTLDGTQKNKLRIGSRIRQIGFSPDAKTLAIASDSVSIRMWNVSSLPQLRALHGLDDHVSSLSYSPDGKFLAVGGYQKIMLRDASSDTEAKTLLGYSSSIDSVAISPDGKLLASAGAGEVYLSDISTGKIIKRLKRYSPFVAFSPDGKTLATSDYINEKGYVVELLDVSSDKSTSVFISTRQGCEVVAFSPDGKKIACGKGRALSESAVELLNIGSGEVIHSLGGFSGNVWSVAFSRDGRVLASGGSDNVIRLWDVRTGIQLRELNGHTDAITCVAFIGDDVVASADEDGVLMLWEVHSGRELSSNPLGLGGIYSFTVRPHSGDIAIRSENKGVNILRIANSKNELSKIIRGYSYNVDAVTVSSNGKVLAVGKRDLYTTKQNSDRVVKLWSADGGTSLRTIKGPDTFGIEQPVLSPSGDLLAVKNWRDIRLLNARNGAVNRILKNEGEVSAISFSPNGKLLANAVEDNTVRLWNIDTGAQLHVLKGLPCGVRIISFVNDGKYLASACSKYLRVWDVSSGELLRETEINNSKLAFSKDGRLIVGIVYDPQSGDSIAQIFAVETAELYKTFPTKTYVTSAALSLDNSLLAVGDISGRISLWDVSTGREKAKIAGHADTVNTIAFSPNGKIIISGGRDSQIKMWSVSDGAEVGTLTTLEDGNGWLLTTPQGLFDGTPDMWARTLWRFSGDLNDVLPVESFYNEFYYPELLPDLISAKSLPPTRSIATLNRQQPRLKLTTLSDESSGDDSGKRIVTLGIEVLDAPAGARDIRLFRNGLLVKSWHGDVLKGGKSNKFEASLKLVAGLNVITSYVFNSDNIKSEDSTLILQGDRELERKGKTYILAIGIDQYSNPKYNLKYAVADAKDFSDEFKNQQSKLGTYEKIEVTSLRDEKATKANILNYLNELSSKVQPEDAVIIYFAGHGTAQGNRFYLIPHDLGYSGNRMGIKAEGLNQIISHSISDEELESALENVNPGQMLMVIDACNSGQALEAEEKRRGPMNSKGLAQLAYEKGMYILTASQSYQAALEASALGHGFLTYALVEEGLKKGAADKGPKDGQIYVREWFDFAAELVPQMQMSKMQECRDILAECAFLEGEEKIKEVEKRSVQTPRVFYRRELEANPLVVAKPAGAGATP